jgi:hypothetical protein
VLSREEERESVCWAVPSWHLNTTHRQSFLRGSLALQLPIVTHKLIHGVSLGSTSLISTAMWNPLCERRAIYSSAVDGIQDIILGFLLKLETALDSSWGWPWHLCRFQWV